MGKAKNLSHIDRQARQDLIRDIQQQQVSTIEAKDPILGEDGKLLKQQQLKRKTKTTNEGVQLDNNNNGTLHNNNGIDIANDTSIKSKSKRPKRLGNGIT